MTDYGLDLNADFLGRATGAFADQFFCGLLIDTFALFVDYGGRHSLAKDFTLTGFIYSSDFFVGIVLTQSY